ncbi:MAG: right-handed parallel beta-helix repeat-containing protein [Planctomycetota bacterium]
MTLALCIASVQAEDRPAVIYPRQTSGDHAVEPSWQENVTVTVGHQDADIIGRDQRAIQAAIDYVARLGGGTVHIKAGTYRLRNAVYLQSGVHLTGEGPATLLVKEPSATTPLLIDSDWYDQEVTLKNDQEFQIGDGVCLRAKDTDTGREVVVKRTLTARSGNRFRLDKPLRENLWQLHQATCSTLFPLLSGEFVEDIQIKNLTLDGHREQNAELDGNHAGCLFLQDCNRITICNVTARNFHGDGISWQICHDVIVENCVSENNTNLALHPGSGSQRPIIRNNVLRGCDIGIFFCWGVKYGIAENNTIEGNRIGISIGHRDTDNLIVSNTIRSSHDHGILFRPERGPDFAGHRNRIERNCFTNNAQNGNAVIEIQGGTADLQFRNNTFQNDREAVDTVSIRKGPQTRNILIEGSQLTGVRPGE